MRIGVLALQGAFIEHIRILQALGTEARPIRLPVELEGLDGLIIPGGESTAIGKLAVTYGLLEPIRQMAKAGRPVWGTCAGLILLAQEVEGEAQPLLGLMDIRVRRNAFGRQVDSFEAGLLIPALDAVAGPGEQGLPFHTVFIRAPQIIRVGDGVTALARLEDGTVVAAQQGGLLATAFHPELTRDVRFHRYFLSLAANGQGTASPAIDVRHEAVGKER
ncbi:MAG: pyridoxal 5'-phosphate synthase glutaminase subunit PdxT [Anaerolineae bacterium]|nr:pyridoxal 5'-phosphate synthase glutaminase subunit PdxT [Anaerolineae bacterium]